jgi:hypothetical protein
MHNIQAHSSPRFLFLHMAQVFTLVLRRWVVIRLSCISFPHLTSLEPSSRSRVTIGENWVKSGGREEWRSEWNLSSLLSLLFPREKGRRKRTRQRETSERESTPVRTGHCAPTKSIKDQTSRSRKIDSSVFNYQPYIPGFLLSFLLWF